MLLLPLRLMPRFFTRPRDIWRIDEIWSSHPARGANLGLELRVWGLRVGGDGACTTQKGGIHRNCFARLFGVCLQELASHTCPAHPPKHKAAVMLFAG